MRRYFTEDPDPTQGQTSPPPLTNDTIDPNTGATELTDTIGGDDVVKTDDDQTPPATEPAAPGDSDEEKQQDNPSA